MDALLDQRGTPRPSFRLPLDPARLQRARERIRDYLHERRVASRAVNEIVLAVEEAMTNAVLHSGSQSDLEVDLQVEDGVLTVSVRGQGKGLDVAPFDRTTLPDPLATGERGLYLIMLLFEVARGLSGTGPQHRKPLSCSVSCA